MKHHKVDPITDEQQDDDEYAVDGGADLYPVCPPPPPEPPVTTLVTVVIANTETIVVPPAQNTAPYVAPYVSNTVVVANTAIDLSGLFKDPITFNWNGATWTVPNFNIDLLTYSTGTPDTMTTTTSSANTSPIVIANTLPGLTAPKEIMTPKGGGPGIRGMDMMNVV